MMSAHSASKLDYSLPVEIEYQVKNSLPELFSGRFDSVLYVGANQLRQHFLSDFVKLYKHVTILEIFDKNVRYLEKKFMNTNVRIVRGDVRNAKELFTSSFDVCFFYHGPEHLKREETGTVLSMLESMANHIIVLGMPYGYYEQGSEYGNMDEAHLWSIYPKDMHELGYKVNTIGKADDSLANMIAWKYAQIDV